MADSALIVPVPEAEGRFGTLRAHFDPSAAQGVPPHVTLLVPFMPPRWIDAGVARTIGAVVAGVAPFEVVFGRVGRWPETVWLAPEPSAPFVALTQALVACFPAYPPYGGRHPRVVPHLTLADGSAAGAASAARAAQRLLDADGPLRARCVEVALIENSDGIWRTMRTFALGGPAHCTASTA
jgi:2'-5' RNA ligase